MRLKLCTAFSLILPLLLLTSAVLGVSCSSSKHGAGRQSFGQAEKIEALPFDEEGRRFDNLYLAALSQKLAGNLDAYYTLLSEAQKLNPNAAEVYYELAQLSDEFPSLVRDSVLENPIFLLKKALNNAPQNRDIRMALLEHLIDKGQFTESINQCDTLLAQKYSENVATVHARLLYSCGEERKTLEAAEKILQHGGDEEYWMGLISSLLAEMKDSVFAIEKARTYYDENPNNMTTNLYVGVLMEHQMYDKAREIINQQLEKNPKNLDILSKELALIINSKDTTTQAKEKVRQYLLNPDGPENLKTLISISFPQNCLSDSTEIKWASEELLTLALSTPQKSTSILEYLAKALEKEQEALQISNEDWADTCYVEFNGHRIDPPATFVDYEKLESLTAERQKRGINPLFHVDSLNTIYEKILEIDPTNEKIRFKLLQSYSNDQDYDRLEKICIDAMEYDEYLYYYGYYGAMAMLNKGKDHDALLLLRQTTQGEDETQNKELVETVFSTLGELEDQEGNIKESMAAYEKVLEINPYNATVANNLAYTLSKENRDLDRAEELILLALDISPNEGYIWDTYAWILYQKGDYVKAKEAIDYALQYIADYLNPATYYLHAGDIYYKVGQKKKANTFWQKALRSTTDAQEKAEINKRIKTQRVP